MDIRELESWQVQIEGCMCPRCQTHREITNQRIRERIEKMNKERIGVMHKQ